MHKVEIPQAKIFREIPSQIEEMDQDQFVFYISLVLEYISGQISIDIFKIKLIKCLLGIIVNPLYFRLPEAEKQQIHSNLYILAQLCDSFFEEYEQDGKPGKAFRLRFTKNFIPSICGKYFGPQDALQDVTFCEYRTAHQFYASYIKSHDQNDLNHMIAVLYRPKKKLISLLRRLSSFDGQERRPFTAKSNPRHLESRARDIASLPLPVRYGIFLYFSGCEEFLQKGCIEVEGKEIDFSVLYEQKEKIEGMPDIGVLGMLYTMAETHVFGSVEQTDNQNLFDVLIRLYQVVQQNKAIDAKYLQKNGTS